MTQINFEMRFHFALNFLVVDSARLVEMKSLVRTSPYKHSSSSLFCQNVCDLEKKFCLFLGSLFAPSGKIKEAQRRALLILSRTYAYYSVRPPALDLLYFTPLLTPVVVT